MTIKFSRFIFFTDITTNASNYCLLNIKKYNDPRKTNKKLIMIDPSVYELKNLTEYTHVNQLHKKVNDLNDNEYISIDYPCDMNTNYTDIFIQKSIDNNLKYANNPKYICTIQSKFQDFEDFKKQYEYLESKIDFSRKIIGIGNICRILHQTDFSRNVFSYLSTKTNVNWFHIYGISLKHLSEFEYDPNSNVTISVDGTKWTRRINKNGVLAGAICCRKDTRDAYFLEYMRVIEERLGCKIEY